VISEGLAQVREEVHQASLENDAARQNPTIPAAYKEEARKKLDQAVKKMSEAEKKERERILREYQTELKEMEKCPAKTDKETMVPGSGGYLGGELVKSWGRVRSTERLADTNEVTNQFSDTADPVGGGFLIGYKFAPWANSFIISPFASFDFTNAPVNHNFPNGSYLGSTAKFMTTGGVKFGPDLGTGFWLYGIAGVSGLKQTLDINFVPVSSARSAWVAGATVGVGGAIKPSFLQGFGYPVSVFAEYQHTWWQDANFNTPAASPFFNYNFRREDDLLKVGFTLDLVASPPASSAPMYVKARPAK
jgi:hypothetical protein